MLAPRRGGKGARMSLIDRYAAYAAAFEETYADDDWSRLEQFFTEDAVNNLLGGPPFAGRHEGRAEILEQLRNSVNAFDRKFDKRTLEILTGPNLKGNEVNIEWAATYEKVGAPLVRIEGTERAVFEGDRIALLEDGFAEGTGEKLMAWMAEHGTKLG